MGTNNLEINLHDSPDQAPKYDLPEFKAANIDKIVIVKKGTVEGNPTVDLVFSDESGQKFVAMITARLLKQALNVVP